MKYLKYFNQDAEYQQFKESEDYVLPNVSYVKDITSVMYNPKLRYLIKAKYNATDDNLRCFRTSGAHRVTSLIIDDKKIVFEPYVSLTNTIDIFANNIVLAPHGELDGYRLNAEFPNYYCSETQAVNWAVRAKDQNYKVNEKTRICYFIMYSYDPDYRGIDIDSPVFELLNSEWGFITNDDITFMANANKIKSLNDAYTMGGELRGLGLCEVDENDNVIFIDSECIVTINKGGLSEYYFETPGTHNVEIEVSGNVLPDFMFNGSNLTQVELNKSFIKFSQGVFGNTKLQSIVIPESIVEVNDYNTFADSVNLQEIICYPIIAPLLKTTTQLNNRQTIFDNIAETGVFKYPKGSDYSAWIALLPEGWTTEEF